MTIHFDNTIHITPVPDGVSKQEFNQEVGRLDERIDVIEASSDVTNVVGTYSDLENYDTSTLTDKDIIKVLEDATHDDAISYYRWSTTSESFTFIGSLGPYPTQSYVDSTFSDKSLSNLSANGNARLHALKGYADTGELLTDTEGLSDVKSYAHSTFDSSKFTVTGTPTITDDGIASGFSSSNYLKPTLSTFDVTKNWEIRGTVTTGSTLNVEQGFWSYSSTNVLRITSTNLFSFIIYTSVSDVHRINGINTVSANTTYEYVYGWNGTKYYMDIYTNNTLFEHLEYSSQTSCYISGNYPYLMYGNFGANLNNYWQGSIDLKQFSVTVDGVPMFSGNKTGVDTYTINNSTVTVPYTLSKTGSKIADSIYRTQVQAVYNEFGYAPYYTLSDTNFTLPQGELYGMMRKLNPPIVKLTQAEYDALVNGGTVDESVIYFIVSSN